MTRTPALDRATPPAWHGLALVCAAGVVWGTIGPAVALVDERSTLHVLTVGAWRAVVALAVLATAVVVTGRVAACRTLLSRHAGRAAGVGVLTAAFQLLFFVAVVATGVSVATVVALGVAPVLLLVLDGVRARRLPSAGRTTTVAAAVVGLVLVALSGPATGEPAHVALGGLAAAASGAAYALSTDLGAPLTRRHDAWAVTAVTMSFTTAVLVVVGLCAWWWGGAAAATRDTWSWVLVGYLGVVTMALAYVLLFAGLRTTPSGTVVVATLLEPVTAVLIAVTFLGERLTTPGLLGSLLIIGAIAGSGRRLDTPQPQ